ncbi:hypothetical protein [Shewanella xiamenensis]|uniref:hypothetical protein n=1 Tax=Shewanella xiamenensis TaxID=332186 RepID=UPI00217D5314|nr:hypothetical protein [Shewanella xiamenensis]MCT8874157.1 hypothetical protein [Shewanella xiamenensis]UWH42828.1 hypothetical protein KXJ80_06095 [Shewanella xiamenensis]
MKTTLTAVLTCFVVSLLITLTVVVVVNFYTKRGIQKTFNNGYKHWQFWIRVLFSPLMLFFIVIEWVGNKGYYQLYSRLPSIPQGNEVHDDSK